MQNKLNQFGLLPRLRFGEAGIAPIILIIIFTIVIAGVAGVAYKSRKEIKVRSDKTTEVTELKGTPEPEPKKQEVDLANSGKLSDKPVEVKTEEDNAKAPKFSITSPAGWERLSPAGNILLEFLSPVKDTIEGKIAFFDVQSNITVFVVKGDYENLEEANKSFSKNTKIDSRQKTTINGREALVTQSTQDVAGLLRDSLEAQIRQEIAKSKIQISEAEWKEDMEKVLEEAKVKVISYSFYTKGYYINVAGKALESYWSKREAQIKKSMDTFKLE